MRRFIGIALIVLLTVLATVAEQTRAQLWQGFESYASPYLGPLPSGATQQLINRRTVVVLVRGLRLAESRQMPALNALRERGADVTVELSPPTYRTPAWFSLFSGARPDVHGVTVNTLPTTRPDTLFRALQSAGRGVAVIASADWNDLVEGAVQRLEIVEEADPALHDTQAVNTALDVLRDAQQPAAFVLIELTLMEDIARTDPPSYSAAAAATDVRLKSIVDGLDLNADTLVVLADRGLTQQGNDGGGDAAVARTPMVLAGAGVAPGTQAIAKGSDVVPTLAALAGAPMPVHGQGGPVLSVLAPNATAPLPMASAQQLTTFYEQWAEVMGQPRFASELLRQRQGELAGGDIGVYERWQAELNALVNAATVARLSAERAARLPFVIGVGLLLLAVTGALLSTSPLPPLAGAAAYAAVWFVLFTLVRGSSYSLSLFSDGNPAPALNEIERESAILMGVLCLLVALTTGGHDDVFEAITTVLCTLGLVAIFLAAQFMWFYWQWGDAFTWTLPESSAFVAALIALTQLAAMTVQITPALPEVPLALLAAIGAAIIYAVMRRHESL
jgi:hypothetical protein